MSVNPLEDLKYGRRTLNVARFREVDHDLYMAKIKNVTGESLDEMAPEIGQLALNATDENGVPVVIISAINLLNEYGVDAHFIGFDPETGVAQVWINAATGKITAGAGSATMGADGIVVNGLDRLLKFVATNSGNTGTGYIRMRVHTGSGKPVLSISTEETMTITNLVPDNSFESGAFSPDWSAHADFSVVQAPTPSGVSLAPYDGSKMVEFDANSLTGRSLNIASRLAVTEGLQYIASARWASNGVGSAGSQLACQLKLEWYDAASGGNLLRTDLADMGLSSGVVAWRELAGSTNAPVGATHVSIILFVDAQVVGDYAWIDDVQFYEYVPIAEMLFSQDAILRGGPLLHDPIGYEPDVPSAGARSWADFYSGLLKTKSHFDGHPALVAGFARPSERRGFGVGVIGSGIYQGLDIDMTVMGTPSFGNLSGRAFGLYRQMTGTANFGYNFPNQNINWATQTNIYFAIAFTHWGTLSDSYLNFGLATATPAAFPPGSGTYCVIGKDGSGALQGRSNIGSSTVVTSTLPTLVYGHDYLLSWVLNVANKTVLFNVYDRTADEHYSEEITLTGTILAPASRFYVQFGRKSGTLQVDFYHTYVELFDDKL
jgi:hypothetical protein